MGKAGNCQKKLMTMVVGLSEAKHYKNTMRSPRRLVQSLSLSQILSPPSKKVADSVAGGIRGRTSGRIRQAKS